MKDYTPLLQEHFRFLLQHAQTILNDDVYANCMVTIPTYYEGALKMRPLKSFINTWLTDVRYEGERIYLLDYYGCFRGMFNIRQGMFWITEAGELQRHEFKFELPGKLVIYDSEGKEHLFPYKRKNPVYIHGQYSSLGLCLPLPHVIHELKHKNKTKSRAMRRLCEEGWPTIRQYLLDAGADIRPFYFNLSTPDDESVRLSIRVPHKEVKAHLNSEQPMVDKSIVGRRAIFQEVADSTGGKYNWVYDNKKYIYFFERHFSFSELHYMLQEQHLQELVQLIHLINSAFLEEQ
ncbi:MAG: hypothetical protein ACLFT3_08890 [Cyclobacteriaceae bacterium]